ncbi:transposase [Nocardia sp. NPDC050799]|uniref:transposase n=1 Tax=Nocardia sp. NPDC050799 TaxID=3154842 RepID=UPI0033DEBDFB
MGCVAVCRRAGSHQGGHLVTLAMDLTAWMQTLAFGQTPARRWEAKAPRLRLFSIPARLARHARRVHLRLPAHHPFTALAATAFTAPRSPLTSINRPCESGRRALSGPVESGSQPAGRGSSRCPDQRN